ncbi:OmpA family protein, partial [bacterium]|nr:OmpA family protein [bacterium]
PDVGLVTEDKVPREWRAGLAWRIGSFYLTRNVVIEDVIFPAFDITYRQKDNTYDSEELNIHGGLECWFAKKSFGFRFGGNMREITFGLSYNNESLKGLGLEIDYAFIWPLEIKDSIGTHRVGLTARFGEEPGKRPRKRKIKTRTETIINGDEALKREREEALRRAEEAEAAAKEAKLEAEQARLEAEAAKRRAEEEARRREELKAMFLEAQRRDLEVRKEESGLIITIRPHFVTGKTYIREIDKPHLNQVAELLNQYPKYKIKIEGHTDSVGTEMRNLTLSERRAQGVTSYLMSRGVSPTRLTSIGFGETKPIASNRTIEGRFANRRVEFVVLREE